MVKCCSLLMLSSVERRSSCPAFVDANVGIICGKRCCSRRFFCFGEVWIWRESIADGAEMAVAT